MSSIALNAASIGLSVVTSIFFVVGCIGYGDNSISVQSVPWILSKKDGTDVYFGLRNVFFSMANPFFGGDFTFFAKYSDDANCPEDWCEVCYKDGKAAFALTLVALAFTTCVVCACIALMVSFSRTFQMVNAAFAFLAFATSLIGVGLFMKDCFYAIDDATDGDDDGFYGYGASTRNLDLKWGPGSILTITGMLLMFVVTILQIAAVVGTGVHYTAAPNRV
jgi:hypothetical protein